MAIKYLKSSKIKNKTVLLRVDVNVPLNEETGKVLDDFRIRAILPTIQLLRESGNKVIILGHLGRPEGHKDSKLSLEPVAECLSDLLGLKFLKTTHEIPQSSANRLIFYTGDIMEGVHQKHLESIPNTDLVMLENIRFYKGEELDEAPLSKKLASLADVYVNDAFSVSHRNAASIVGVTKYIPSYCGPLLEQEIKSLTVILERSKKPMVVMMGGIKISDKSHTLEYLGKHADKILLGGGLSTLMFFAKKLEVGISKIEEDAVKTAWHLAKNLEDKIVLPVDVVVADEHMSKNSIRVTTPYEIGKKEQILDIGPKTILLYANELKEAKTIVWNGPMGKFEIKPFHTGTIALARIVGAVGKRKAFTLVGGGETVDAIILAGQFEHIDHVSTGGGAMLEFLAGKKLPGIEALK